jgi:TRAP-type C4-dicarboxylate transport system substrate-binding protein
VSGAAFVLLAAACGGSAFDKAGAARPAKSVVLRLAAHDDGTAYGTFAAAVDRLSGGSLRIRIARNWRASDTRDEIDYERGIVDDVRSGKIQLGIVGVRVWDTLGVDRFQALVAPFLIDTLTLERQALEKPFARQTLASVRKVGVVGIALLPGSLRRPLGLTRVLVRLQDYRGARIAIRLGEVARATFHALGAIPAGSIPSDGSLSGFDGVEIDPLTITENSLDAGAHALTGNVIYWPKAQTIVMNRNSFDRLTQTQQQILAAAGRQALIPELTRLRHDQQLGVAALCAGTLPIVTASSSELAALRRAVQPVYDQLDRNPFTRQWIGQIERFRDAEPAGAAALRCPGRTRKEKSP